MTAALAESFSTRTLDIETLLELSRRTDPDGVLSIYLDARPHKSLRAASIDIQNRLGELERRLARDGSPERARAVHDATAAVTPEIDRFTDPAEPGRGRIMFAAIGEAWLVRVSSQSPLPNRVVLDDTPFIHPLLEILDEGGAAGLVVASRTEARLLEWRLGELVPLRELSSARLEPPHERSGPIGSRPGSRYGSPTGEQRNARERDQVARFVAGVADAASHLAHERGWGRVLVGAGEHLTDPLIRALTPALREVALREPRVLVRMDLKILEGIVSERMHRAHQELERELIRTVREDALGAGTAALGLSEVVGALNQARVGHLFYDPSIRYRGSVGPDGSLFAEDETRLKHRSTLDARLTERIVERALETGARVTPVEGAASKDLAETAGIAAVLRW